MEGRRRRRRTSETRVDEKEGSVPIFPRKYVQAPLDGCVEYPIVSSAFRARLRGRRDWRRKKEEEEGEETRRSANGSLSFSPSSFPSTTREDVKCSRINPPSTNITSSRSCSRTSSRRTPLPPRRRPSTTALRRPRPLPLPLLAQPLGRRSIRSSISMSMGVVVVGGRRRTVGRQRILPFRDPSFRFKLGFDLRFYLLFSVSFTARGDGKGFGVSMGLETEEERRRAS